ncbi:hypothetical protein L596_006863 [Steinernema carpocapsae]|uniref:Uncharacterized protein n=1 Tax=Steinernema carpocapsae TaxID=34508 RepID=A0A4U5P889_STECR|nr:hypothetical protein L596_006863 [Steinernema carpocapsae]
MIGGGAVAGGSEDQQRNADFHRRFPYVAAVGVELLQVSRERFVYGKWTKFGDGAGLAGTTDLEACLGLNLDLQEAMSPECALHQTPGRKAETDRTPAEAHEGTLRSKILHVGEVDEGPLEGGKRRKRGNLRSLREIL